MRKEEPLKTREIAAVMVTFDNRTLEEEAVKGYWISEKLVPFTRARVEDEVSKPVKHGPTIVTPETVTSPPSNQMSLFFLFENS